MPLNKKLNRFAKNLRKKATDTENKIWNALRAKRFEGLKFRRQQIIGDFIVDFVCLEKRLIIECNVITLPLTPSPQRLCRNEKNVIPNECEESAKVRPAWCTAASGPARSKTKTSAGVRRKDKANKTRALPVMGCLEEV